MDLDEFFGSLGVNWRVAVVAAILLGIIGIDVLLPDVNLLVGMVNLGLGMVIGCIQLVIGIFQVTTDLIFQGFNAVIGR